MGRAVSLYSRFRAFLSMALLYHRRLRVEQGWSARSQKGCRQRPQRFGRAVEIHRLLGVQPEFRRGPESRAELQRHLRCNTRSAIYDPVDHLDLAAEVIGHLPLRQTERLQELLPQDLARARGLSVTQHLCLHLW